MQLVQGAPQHAPCVKGPDMVCRYPSTQAGCSHVTWVDLTTAMGLIRPQPIRAPWLWAQQPASSRKAVVLVGCWWPGRGVCKGLAPEGQPPSPGHTCQGKCTHSLGPQGTLAACSAQQAAMALVVDHHLTSGNGECSTGNHLVKGLRQVLDHTKPQHHVLRVAYSRSLQRKETIRHLQKRFLSNIQYLMVYNQHRDHADPG